MPVTIIKDDITNVKADIIVNTANPFPIYAGNGVDYAIYSKCGLPLLEERKKIGNIEVGKCALTKAYNLNAKYILHTVAKDYEDENDYEVVRNCYRSCLQKAKELKVNSIAFPLIGTGAYDYPKDKVFYLANEVFQSYLNENELDIILVIYKIDDYTINLTLKSQLDDYLSEKNEEFYEEVSFESPSYERSFSFVNERPVAAKAKPIVEDMLIGTSFDERDLDWLAKQQEKDTVERLFELIDRSGKKDSEVYLPANISRQTFSKFRNRKINLTRNNIIALCLALKLNLDDTLDVLKRSHYTLGNDTFDRLIIYFIEHNYYNIPDIDASLFQYTGKTLTLKDEKK